MHELIEGFKAIEFCNLDKINYLRQEIFPDKYKEATSLSTNSNDNLIQKIEDSIQQGECLDIYSTSE